MPDLGNDGKVELNIQDGVGYVTFSHPKGNSLPGTLLKAVASEIDLATSSTKVKVIVLKSEGTGAFCAGASFDELQSIKDHTQGQKLFYGFAQIIFAIRRSTKFVIARVQGKAVGGGVGLVAAADYALADQSAAARLSELALGIGPFVVGPAVERKIGLSAFAAMSIDYDWRDANWCLQQGLYQAVYQNQADLDKGVAEFSKKMAATSPEAIAQLKAILWQGTENWDQLLKQRAAISGNLVLSDFTKKYLEAAKSK